MSSGMQLPGSLQQFQIFKRAQHSMLKSGVPAGAAGGRALLKVWQFCSCLNGAGLFGKKWPQLWEGVPGESARWRLFQPFHNLTGRKIQAKYQRCSLLFVASLYTFLYHPKEPAAIQMFVVH